MGLLVHILGIFSGFLGPIIIYLIKRDSKFVSFHALQCVLWHLLYWVAAMVLILLVFVLLFVAGIAQIVQLSNQHGAGTPPFFLFLMFPIFWLTVVVFGMLNVVLGLIFGMKAGTGEWTSYPFAGAWARRLVGLEG